MTEDLHDELHRHAAALRGIARDLLRCPHAADDIAQATLHQALAQKNLQPGPLGGWLQRTLVNFARQWRRGERRLATRHQALPRPEAPAEPRETLARREVLQSVTTAVLQLDEPYQTAIFLRYFEDLPPRAIAARTGTNLATVKSRLARGLLLLRARLDRDHRADWRLGLATTFGLGLPMAAAGLTLTSGAWLVGTTTKTLLAAGVLLAGGLLAYGLGREPAPTPADGTQRGHDLTATDRQAAAGQAAQQSSVREEVVADAPGPVGWLDHPFPFQLEVLVTDDLGIPVEGHWLRLAPDGCALDRPEAATDAHGKVTLAWRGRRPTCRLAIEDGDDRLHRLEIKSGSTAFLTLGSTTGPLRGGMLISFASTSDIQVVHGANPAGSTGGAVPVLSEVPIVGRLFTSRSGSSSLAMQTGLHPFATFTDNAGKELEAEEGNGGVTTIRLDGASLSFAVNETIARGEASESQVSQPLPAIAGTVFGDDGKPAGKVRVCVFGEGPQPIARTQCDDHGQFRFDDLAAGKYTVRAGGGPQGLATTEVAITKGTTPATLQLQRGACVRGRVVDGKGAPVAGAQLTWQSLDGRAWDATLSEKDGTFVFANQPGGPGRVLCWPSDDFPLPLACAPSVLPDTGSLDLVCDMTAGGVLQLDANRSPDSKLGTPQVRVWQVDTGASAVVSRPEKGKPWRLEHLPAGWYDVELRTPGLGFVAAGRQWVDGTTLTDLGQVPLPEPAALRFDFAAAGLPTEQRQFDLCALRADMDVHLVLSENFTEREMLVPAGDYVMSWLRQNGTVEHQRFAVRGGETKTIAVGAR